MRREARKAPGNRTEGRGWLPFQHPARATELKDDVTFAALHASSVHDHPAGVSVTGPVSVQQNYGGKKSSLDQEMVS